VKTALVTGASRGVGRATALGLGARGYRLELLGRASDDQLETERSLRAQGTLFEFADCDLGDFSSTDRAIELILARAGAPEVVIHNAGIVERAAFAEFDDASWQRQLDVNLTAPFRVTRALLPAMLAARSGRILFVSSISAVVGSPRQVAYNVSKAGLVALMRCLAEELSDTGLMTAAVLPGAIDTDMLRGSGYAARMTADEVARTLVFLATEASLAHNGGVTEMFGV